MVRIGTREDEPSKGGFVGFSDCLMMKAMIFIARGRGNEWAEREARS